MDIITYKYILRGIYIYMFLASVCLLSLIESLVNVWYTIINLGYDELSDICFALFILSIFFILAKY